MKKYQLFLSYYTLLVSLGLFVWSVFWGPKPQSLLLAFLFVPIGLYFWLILFNNYSVQASETNAKLPLIILLALFISVTSILAYDYFSPNPLVSQMEALRAEVAKIGPLAAPPSGIAESSLAAQLRRLETELAGLKNKNASPAATGSLGDEAFTVGLVTIKDAKNKTADLYQDKSLKGAVVGKIDFGKSYPFIDKDPAWYLILFNGKQGYVASNLVKEYAD